MTTRIRWNIKRGARDVSGHPGTEGRNRVPDIVRMAASGSTGRRKGDKFRTTFRNSLVVG